MDYTILGFTFTFTQDYTGQVIAIATPDIPLGLTTIQGYTLYLQPGLTVSNAEAMVSQILAGFGIS